MSDKQRAKEALLKLAKHHYQPEIDKLKDTVEEEVYDAAEDNLGLDKESVQRALALAELARSRKIKGKTKIGDNTSLEGELDFKNKAVRVGLNHSF